MQSINYSVQCTVYSVQYTIYTVLRIMYIVNCAMYSVQYTLYKLYTVQIQGEINKAIIINDYIDENILLKGF